MTMRALLAACACLLLGGAPAALADDEAKAPTATEKADAPKDEGKGKAEKPEIPWAKSYADALERARKDKKLVMVDVYTDWCGWCKKLDADTYSDPKVVKQADQFVAVKVDAEDKKEGTEFATRFKVQGFPTILFIDPTPKDGPAIEAKIGGYMPPGPFGEKIDSIAGAHRDFPKLQERVEANPEDLEALGKLVVIYGARQDPKHATELLDRGLKKDPENASGTLTKALSAVADSHQEEKEFDEAIPLFRKAAKTAKDPAEAAYAQSSIAMCFLQQGKLDDAIPELEAVTKLEGAPKEDKERAESILKQIHVIQDKAKKEKDKKDKGDEKDEDKDK